MSGRPNVRRLKLSKTQKTIIFVINQVPDDVFDEIHQELSELTRKLPYANFRFKQNGKVSCPFQDMPILDEREAA